jgi:Flp pilus assembly protein CpaB
MRRSPRSVLAWSAALVVVIVTAVVVFGDLSRLHRRARDLGDPHTVFVAAHDLPLGATLGANDLEGISRYASMIPDQAIVDPDDALGRIVAVPVVAGSVVRAAHLTDRDRGGVSGLVPVGYRAVRVRPEDGLRPPAGTVVDVLVALDPTLSDRTEANVVAHAARVLSVEPDDGATVDGTGVTLLVTEDEARELAFAAANGVLTLALAPPEDACCRPPDS